MTDTFGSRSLGHLLTSNNAMLKKNEIAFGSLYVGYGITDSWTVATSPFVYMMFLTSNFATRWAQNISATQRVGFEFQYFKSFGAESPNDRSWREFCGMGEPIPFGSKIQRWNDCDGKWNYPNGFESIQMEAYASKFTYSNRITPFYKINLTSSYFYYIDDERPFSLRMDPQNDDRFALSLTTLHEMRITENIFLNFEAGIWGLNYTYPYIHAGTTFNVQNKHFLAGVGASTTFSPSFPQEKVRLFRGYDSRMSFHPELQIETFF